MGTAVAKSTPVMAATDRGTASSSVSAGREVTFAAAPIDGDLARAARTKRRTFRLLHLFSGARRFEDVEWWCKYRCSTARCSPVSSVLSGCSAS